MENKQTLHDQEKKNRTKYLAAVVTKYTTIMLRFLGIKAG